MTDDELRQAVMASESYGFHAIDGWHFQRQEGGRVRVVITTWDGKTPHTYVEFTPETWASIVASVCARGEDAGTFMEAKSVHMRTFRWPGEAGQAPDREESDDRHPD